MKKFAKAIGLAATSLSLAACLACAPTDKPEDSDCVITFSAGQGAFVDGKTSVDVKPNGNGNVTMTSAPRRDGYAFDGWYDGAVKFDPAAQYAQDRTFTAKYVSGGESMVYDALFDEDARVTVDINMSDAEWKKLNQDYLDFNANGGKSPIYRMSNSVTIGIDGGDGYLYYYYEEVGVRMKGNTSRHTFYGDDGFTNNIHMKLSFKETFDDIDDGYTQDELKEWTDEDKRDERKARTLGGMEKIDVKYPLYINLIDNGAPTDSGSTLMRYRQNLIDLSASRDLNAAAFNAYKDKFKAKYGDIPASAIYSNRVAFDDSNTGNVPYSTYIATKLKTLNDNIDNYNP